MEEKLPIGTIVRLKGYENYEKENNVLHMITGYEPISKEGKKYDYMCTVFPYGLVDDEIFMINEEEIFEIKHMGYEVSLYENKKEGVDII